jgi:hypothetical protein
MLYLFEKDAGTTSTCSGDCVGRLHDRLATNVVSPAGNEITASGSSGPGYAIGGGGGGGGY